MGNPVLNDQQVHPGGQNFVPGPFIIGQKERNFAVIGNTWYDTQTYNSGNLMNRIYEYPDGFIGATWMHKGSSGTPDRGTAYNYYDGSAWSTQALHLGNDPNNGFPSYAPLSLVPLFGMCFPRCGPAGL